jgi:hypothetical protein
MTGKQYDESASVATATILLGISSVQANRPVVWQEPLAQRQAEQQAAAALVTVQPAVRDVGST